MEGLEMICFKIIAGVGAQEAVLSSDADCPQG